MGEFLLQERRDDIRDIWVPPRARFGMPQSAPSVEVLRNAIQRYADQQDWPWWLHFRIVTRDGDAVERWKTKPGLARKTRRKS
ncbi:hypothetical protein SEA_MARCIE_85 [Microbacterium phage Marcie]|nr:hypothetical protein SEA_MARCIE_85 [Microbacterium phage Marcie]